MNAELPEQLHIVKHPLLQHKLNLLRDVSTSRKTFRELVSEITLLLAYESTKHLSLRKRTIKTPLETMEAELLTEEDPVIVPILRAGLGMVDGLLTLLPTARVGHIGLYRDENTLEPHPYYIKIPKQSEQNTYFLCDPMLATGGTVAHAASQLKQRGIKNIILICLVSAPEGVIHMCNAHPDIPIYTAVLDRQLNEHGYILPGLGDAGDRLFGTL